MADGTVEYEVRADTSHIEDDLNRAEGIVRNAAQHIGSSLDEVAESAEHVANNSGDAASGQNQLAESSENAANKSEKLGSALKITGAALTAIGAAAAAVGTLALSSADNLDKATNQVTASLGLTADEAQRYEETIKSIYANNYGESFEDIANNVALVKQQMSDISDAELQKAVESGYLLNDVFGIDFQESLRGANAMVNQFGISAKEAYNLMAQGAEKGLNQNGDLADQIAEYATYYNNLGFTAEQAFNMMAAGAENGVYQIDKINDAVKEFSIRAIDGSDSTREGFAALGLDADALGKLAEMDDKVAQDAAGVALFGTQWEDLGAEAVLALGAVGDSIDVTRDKLGEMEEVKYDSLSDMFGAMKRSVELLLIPLGEQLIPVVNKVIEAFLPMAEKAVPEMTAALLPLIECVLTLIDPLINLTSDILPMAVELIQPIVETLIQLAEQVFPILSEVIETLLPPLTTIIESLLPPLLSVITALLPVIDTVLTILNPILNLVTALLEPLTMLLNSGIVPLINVMLELINSVLTPLMPLLTMLCELIAVSLSVAVGKMTDTFTSLTAFLSSRVSSIKEMFGGLIDFITGVFTGNWEKAWGGIQKIFKGIWDNIVGVAEFAVNLLIDHINTFISGINELFGWMGANIDKIDHVDWTADNAEEQAESAIDAVNSTKPSGQSTADYYEAQGKAKLAEQQKKEAEEKTVKTAPVISGNTVNGIDYSYIPEISSDTAEKDVSKTTSPKSNASTKASTSTSTAQKNNVISITSYIPTIWDNEDEINEKLKKSLGADLVGNSMTGKLISGLESAAKIDTGTVSAVKNTVENVTLSDVISAIKALEKSDETRKIALDVTLVARDMAIGTIAVEDINDLTRINGKSPLIK